ncbi:hypothetical protein AU106_gp224 [Sinorhizobium phage phiM9]|uniref:Uncharacterized protein n=1 Tax=Sinorhizobium phage phiM9 TaxID=1636182 RepID=A0A0F6R630_9CAUD|nr:hypothetical protein AU106_gp224 [Sinorhizobium phage phiM9]AKE44855.1 hypothetical protein Sm_phiM9_228 [Sinorhizobium phage phiM9]
MELFALAISVFGALSSGFLMEASTSLHLAIIFGLLCALFSVEAVSIVLKMVKDLIKGKDDDDDFDKLAGA